MEIFMDKQNIDPCEKAGYKKESMISESLFFFKESVKLNLSIRLQYEHIQPQSGKESRL